MKNQIKNIGRCILGTAKFDAKFEGMRKEQNFTVYPMAETSDKISCQSEGRWLEIEIATGNCWITSSQSGHHNSWMLGLQKAWGKAKQFTLDADQLEALKEGIRKTTGKSVGNSVITTDNSQAHLI
jgi:hypothetical protein